MPSIVLGVALDSPRRKTRDKIAVLSASPIEKWVDDRIRADSPEVCSPNDWHPTICARSTAGDDDMR